MNAELYRLGLEYYQSAARLKVRLDELRHNQGEGGTDITSADRASRLATLYTEYLDAMHTADYLVRTYGGVTTRP